MHEQKTDQPGKSPPASDRELEAQPGNADTAAPRSKIVNPGEGNPQTNADGSPANNGEDMKRGF